MWCSVECLFARFAYTVFSPILAPFLVTCQTTPRRVCVYDPSTSSHSAETRNLEQAKALYTTSQPRSDSPRKRSRPGGGDEHVVSSIVDNDDNNID